MWKAAFTGRSEKGGGGGGGDTARGSGRPEARRKKSNKSERGDRDDDSRSVISSTSRRHGDDRSERRSRGSQYDDEGSSFFAPSSATYATAPTSRAGVPETTPPLTESALRMLPDDDEDVWEDEEKDAKSERKRRKHRGSGSSDERERRRKSSVKEKERKRSSSPEKSRSKKNSATKSPDKKDKASRRKEPELVQESSRAIPAQGSFEQFPGQYAEGVMGGHYEYSMSGALPSAVPNSQFPGQEVTPYSEPPPQIGISREDSYGAAAEYYLDQGQSVHQQPGARSKSPNMLVNKDTHLISASAVPHPVHDTGNGSAADFYSAGPNATPDQPARPGKLYSASAHTTPTRPGKQSSYSESKPRPPKTGRISSVSAVAPGLGTAAGISVLGRMSGGRTSSSQHHSHSMQQTSSSYQTSSYSGYPQPSQSAGEQARPSQHTSDDNIFYARPSTMNGSGSSAYGVPGSTQGGGMYSGKQGTHSNAGLYVAGAGAAAAGYAAYEMSHQGWTNTNMAAAEAGGGGGGGGGHGPPSNSGGDGAGPHHPGGSSAGGSMMQQGHFHEHKGPMTKLKDGLLNLISTPEDVAKMEMYTEYIGVCKYCFDPRTSAWDAPRMHHYHGKSARRQDSFESLRRRLSNEKLRRRGSQERVDKESRYYASESSRRRREDKQSGIGLAGAGVAAAGAATAAEMMFNRRKNFDDTYSVKFGHRESSAIRRRSRSSSHEQRRRSQYGTVRPDRVEYITVRRSDGTAQRRRSQSADGEPGVGFGTAAATGAALGAAGITASSSRRSNSSSRETRERSGRSEYSPGRRPAKSGGLFGFFSPPSKQRRDCREQQQNRKGFFTFGNGSASSSNSELAFGDGFTSMNGSRTSFNSGVRRKCSTKSDRGRSRRKSDEHLAATIAGIGTTAAALAAAQRHGRVTKRQSRPELGAKRHVRQHVHGSAGSSDDGWEDEVPSGDDESSVDGGLAFGHYDGKRLSSRQSLESVASQSSAGGLGAWGWRWGGRQKGRRTRRSTSSGQQYSATSHGSSNVPGNTALAATGPSAPGIDTTRPHKHLVYLDDTGRSLPSADGRSSTSSAQPPLQFVDPAPISETPSTPGSRHQFIPGAFVVEDAPIYRPAPGKIQQPQPYSPAKPSFTQPGADQAYTVTAGNAGQPDSSRRTQSNPVQTSWGDAALIRAGALGAGAIIAGSALSSGRKSKDQGRVSFGLTDEQQRKQDRGVQREADKKADEERRRLDRTRALKEEAKRSAKEAREEEVRLAREEENRRIAQAKLDQQREQARKDAEEAKFRAEQRAREERERQREIERLEKEAKDRQEVAAAATAEFERQRKVREDAELQQAEYERQRRSREEAYQRDQCRLAEEAQRQDAQQRRWDAERYAREYQDAQHRGRERSDSQKQSSGTSAWAPIAGAVAAATIGAAVAKSASEKRRKSDVREDSPPSRRPPQTSVEFGAQKDGIELRDGYNVREVTPPELRDGERFTNENIFDPDYFNRKQHSASDFARHEELARKAAAKVVADREDAYSPEQHPKESYAEFFASEVKDIISKQPGEKQRSTDPDGDVQVWHTEVDDDETFSRGRDGMFGRNKYAPYGVPSLYVIAPTPPLGSSPTRGTRVSRGASSLAKSNDVDAEREDSPESKDSDKSERSRSISWGEDKTHVYDVQTPESYQERDSYITSPDLKSAGFAAGAAVADAALHDIVVEDGISKTVYGEDEFSTSSSKKKSKDKKKSKKSNSAPEGDDDVENIARSPDHEPPKPFYHQPYFDSVSDFSGIRLDSPGTEGAPPVRGFVEGETDELTPVEEKTQHIPEGFDEDDANEHRPHIEKEEHAAMAGASWEPAVEESTWEPLLNKKEKKKRDKAAKRHTLADSEPSTPVAAEIAPVTEVVESTWEPTLSRKEQKKRDKVAKRMSLGDSEPSTPIAEPEAPMATKPEKTANDDEVYSTLSKKDKKKRDKAAKKAGFADIASEMSTPSWTGDTVVSGDTMAPLSRQQSPRDVMTEQRRSEQKEAKRKEKSSSQDFSFADVTDTILASGGIAAAAAALSDSYAEASPSGSSKKDKKKKKKSKLGEPSYDDPRDSFPAPEETARAEPSGMPGGWDSPERRSSLDEGKQDIIRDPYKYEVKDEAISAGREPPVSSTQETDPWSEWSEPASSKKGKKSKRNSAAFDSIPQVSSPLRSEVAWDDYVGSSAQTNDGSRTESEAARSDPITVVERKSSKQDEDGRQRVSSNDRPRKSSNDDGDQRSRKSGDYFDLGRQVGESPSGGSPGEVKSVASASTGDRSCRRDESRRNSDYFGQPNHAYETQSLAASEPAEYDEGRKKHKRRSKHGDDDTASAVSSSRRKSRHADDDDNMSVLSSRSRRDKEDSSSGKKEKKGIFSNLFNRKSFDGSSSKDGASLSRSSTKDDDDEDRRRRKKKSSRESEYGNDDVDTRSVRSSSRRHRSEDDSKERRRHSTKDDDGEQCSESGSKHHRRRKTDEEDFDDAKCEKHHLRRRTNDDADQSFLGTRVEELPPLPDRDSENLDAAVEWTDGRPLEADSGTELVTSIDCELKRDTNDKNAEPVTSAATSINGKVASPDAARSLQRFSSSTTVPLRFPFGHAPATPGGKDRASSFSSPVVGGPTNSATASPVTPTSARSRQTRPHSSDFKSGFMPLYLVERNRQTPEVEDTLPSLPSSKPSSRSSSTHGSDEYQSAAEELEIDESNFERRQSLTLDTVGANETWQCEEDYLDSQETTPKASEFPQTAIPWAISSSFEANAESAKKAKQEPQFYTWEDFAREEALHEQAQSQTAQIDVGDERAWSKSPATRSGPKGAAAAAMLGTAVVYAGRKLADRSPERESKRKEPFPSAASHSYPLPAPLHEAVAKDVDDGFTTATPSKKSKKKGKKGNNLEIDSAALDENEAIVPRGVDPAMYFAENVPPHKSAYEEPGNDHARLPSNVYASSAAHTLPVYAAQGASSRHVEEGQSRPVTAYKLPETESEPAPLALDERTVQVGDQAEEVAPASRLTWKPSKKTSKKSKKGSTIPEEDVVGGAKKENTDSHNAPKPAPSVDFGLSDFGVVAAGAATAWDLSQAEAFRELMREVTAQKSVGKSAPKSDLPNSGEANDQDETSEVSWALPASKKKGKKGRKSKQTGSEEVEAAVTQPTEPDASFENPELVLERPESNREAPLDAADGPIESPLPGTATEPHDEMFPTVSRKKSKKDKKKSKASIGEHESPEGPSEETAAHSSGPYTLEQTPIETALSNQEHAVAPEHEFAPVVSKEKSKKNTKRSQVFSWESNHNPASLEQELAEEIPFVGLDTETAGVAHEIMEEPTEKPVEQDIPGGAPNQDEVKVFIPAMSSKKSKKDKKKAKALFWDDDEPRIPPQEHVTPAGSPSSALDLETAEIAREILDEPVEKPIEGLATHHEGKLAGDDFGPVSSKKTSKKDKKKKKSALSINAESEESSQVDKDIEGTVPSDETPAADGLEGQRPYDKDHAAVQGTSSAPIAEEAQPDDLWSMPQPFQNSKRDKKKKKTFSWDDEGQPTVETPIQPELATAISLVQVEDKVKGETVPTMTVEEGSVADAGTEPTPFRKQSKKDKKKKKQQNLCDEEVEIATPEKTTEPAGAVESQVLQVEESVTEVKNRSLAFGNQTARESAIDEQPTFSHKQSKKNKKPKQQLSSLRDTERSGENSAPAQENAQLANVEPVEETKHIAQTDSELAVTDRAPPETPDESFHDAEDFHGPTSTDIWHDVEETTHIAHQPSDIPISHEPAVKRSWAEEMDDLDTLQSAKAFAAQSNIVDDVFGIASGSENLETAQSDTDEPQDFMADRGMEYEPERATEDMDAFGEPTPRDPVEWSLSSKKSAKKGKKVRKSISAVAPVVATAAAAGAAVTLPSQDDHTSQQLQQPRIKIEEYELEATHKNVFPTRDVKDSTQDILSTNAPAVEGPVIRDESPSVQFEAQAEPSATQEERPDGFSWAVSTKKKKGKKGKKAFESEDGIPADKELEAPRDTAPGPAIHDVGLMDAIGASGKPSDRATTADVDDLSLGLVSKKDKKKAKKAKKPGTSTPVAKDTVELTAVKSETNTPLVQENDSRVNQEYTVQDDAAIDAAVAAGVVAASTAADEPTDAEQAQPSVAADKTDEFAWIPTSKKEAKKAEKAKRSDSSTAAIEGAQLATAEDTSAEHSAIPVEELAHEKDSSSNDPADEGSVDTIEESLQAFTEADEPNEFTWAPTSKKDKKKAKQTARNAGSTSPEEPAADAVTGTDFQANSPDTDQTEGAPVDANAEQRATEDAPKEANGFTRAPTSKKDRKKAKKAKKSGIDFTDETGEGNIEAKDQPAAEPRYTLDPVADHSDIVDAKHSAIEEQLPGVPPATITDNSPQKPSEMDEDITGSFEPRHTAAEPEDDLWEFSIKNEKGKKGKKGKKSQISGVAPSEDNEGAASVATAGVSATDFNVSLDVPVTSSGNVAESSHGAADSPEFSWSTVSSKKNKKCNNGRHSPTNSAEFTAATATAMAVAFDDIAGQDQKQQIKEAEDFTTEQSVQETSVNQTDNIASQSVDAHGIPHVDMVFEDERDAVSERPTVGPDETHVRERTFDGDRLSFHDEITAVQAGLDQPEPNKGEFAEPAVVDADEFWTLPSSSKKKGKKATKSTSLFEQNDEPDAELPASQPALPTAENAASGSKDSFQPEQRFQAGNPLEEAGIKLDEQNLVDEKSLEATEDWFAPTSAKKRKKGKKNAIRESDLGGAVDSSSKPLKGVITDVDRTVDEAFTQEPADVSAAPEVKAEAAIDTDELFQPATGKKKGKKGKKARQLSANDDWTSAIREEVGPSHEKAGSVQTELQVGLPAPAEHALASAPNDVTPQEPDLVQTATIIDASTPNAQETAAEDSWTVQARGEKAKKEKKGKHTFFDYFADESKTVDSVDSSPAGAFTQAEPSLNEVSSAAKTSPTEPLSADDGAFGQEVASLEADRTVLAEDAESRQQGDTFVPAAIPDSSGSGAFPSAADTIQHEPAVDEGQATLTLKKSKKKAKKDRSSTLDPWDEAAEEGDVKTDSIATLGAIAADTAAVATIASINQAVPEPEIDEWSAFSSKKSKKDKKKAKKSCISSPAFPLEEDLLATQDDARDCDSGVEQPSHVGLAGSEQVTPDDQSRTAVHEPELTEPTETTIHRDVEQSQATEETRAPSRPSHTGSDIDFTAIVAAGLADSGFDPEMVINNPAFQRKSSPSGVAEADPEEVFTTTTSRKKKSQEARIASEVQDSETFETRKDTAASPQGAIKSDLDDIVNQTLHSTGFDPALLAKAVSGADDEPEFSFANSKRKKSKKGKEVQNLPTDDDVDSTQRVASYAALENTPAPDVETSSVGLDSSRGETLENAGAPLEQTSTADKSENAWLVQDEMDVDAMDRAYKAYKKNKRQQKKLKAAAKNAGISDTPESAIDDTERSAAVSHAEAMTSSLPDECKQTDAIQAPSPTAQRSVVSSTFPELERVKRRISGKATESRRPSSGSQPRVFNHTSEVSQHLPTEVLRSPEPSPTRDDKHSEDSQHQDDSTSGLTGVAKVAAGSAAAGAGALAFSAGGPRSTSDKATAQQLHEPIWSFATLDGDRPRSPSTDRRESRPVRDSGYESTAKRASDQTDRSSRELASQDTPDIARPSSSRESLRERRSLEPLRVVTPDSADWSLHTPKQRSGNSHLRTPSGGTPLDPTSKNRASYLFQSPPDNLAEATSPSTATPQPQGDDYFETRSMKADGGTADYEDPRDRATFSPTSPRAPLHAIPEERGHRTHSRKRSKAQAEVGGPAHIKAIRRTETPHEIRAREHALPPTARLASSGTAQSVSNPTSTSDEVYNRLSWPAVDEENDTVILNRSLSQQPPRTGKTPDPRSPSVVSNVSNASGAQFRSAQELRSHSRTSNRSDTPSLRRTSLSGDLRAASRRGDGTGSSVSGARSSPKTIPFEAPPTPPPNDDELINRSASRAVDMNDDVFQGYGDAQQSQVSPTRPPSVRKRQSMHIHDLETRMNQLAAENRALQEASQASEGLDRGLNGQSIQEALAARDLQLQAKDAEIHQIKMMLQPLQEEVARLSAINGELTEANRNLVDDTNGRYATLQAEHQSTQRELESVRHEHGRISSGMRDIVEAEIANSLADKNAEILRLREQLDIAAEQIRALQVQIQSSNSSDFLQQRDEDYFDGSCQKLCQHVQQWVLRFSKTSDNRICRLSTDLNDDKLETRLDSAVLDGSDVDKLLGDRVRRRDVFMSVVMTMVWEYIFTRYLFGMDREQRQKLKALEKILTDVGPPRAVAHWRATTLTLLSKRPQFEEQCAMDTEAVAHEIFGVLCLLLPPPAAVKDQLRTSLQKVLRIAVDLAIEMRTQRAEYIMLPPLQPEYDANGDLVRKVYFNASLMNERSGFFSSNEELAAKHAVVKIVLFPLVVKKGDDIGEGDDEIVVCPAQVLVHNDGTRDKKVVRVMSGAMEIDDPIRSRSRMSGISEVPAGSPSF